MSQLQHPFYADGTTQPNPSIAPLCGFLSGKTHSQVNGFKHITFEDLKRMAKEENLLDLTHHSTKKEAKANCHWFLPSNCSAKTKSAAIAHDHYTALVCDLDGVEYSLANLCMVLSDWGFHRFLVYSTLGHLLDGDTANRWRIVIPLATGMTHAQWSMSQQVLTDLLGGDNCAQRAQQISYLPARYSPHYECQLFDGEPYDHQAETVFAGMVAERQRQLTVEAQAKPAPREAVKLLPGQISPINEFNRQSNIESLMERYGIKRKGKRWCYPGSTGGSPGIVLLDGKYFSHHANDPLSDGYTHDAFDLFCYYEHGNNQDAAIKAAGDMFTTPNGKTLTKANQQAYRAAQDESDRAVGAAAAQALWDKSAKTRTMAAQGEEPARSQQPSSTYNAILDEEQHYCAGNFLHHVDDLHLLKRLATSISAATSIPVHTVFLIGLAAVSSITSRLYRVAYRAGGWLPTGAYLLGEHPPGTAKTRVVNCFTSPIRKALKEVIKGMEERIGKLLKEMGEIAEQKAAKRKKKPLQISGEIINGDITEEDKGKEEELKSQIEKAKHIIKICEDFTTTNTTPEAMDEVLSGSNGFFSCISSEQGLIDSWLGLSYGEGKANNNDTLLNGFDGGFTSTKRVGRAGFRGDAVGCAMLFAQQGSIEKVLKASNGTGLSERFLCISEKHALGTRDFTKYTPIDQAWMDEYRAMITQLVEGMIERIDKDPQEHNFDTLPALQISVAGWQRIDQFKTEIEPHLADGAKYSHTAIRGAAAKADMQVMKIGAILHLSRASTQDKPEIGLDTINSAIGIAGGMLDSLYQLCRDKGIIGVKAEYQSILTWFEKDQKSRTERDIIQAKAQTKPFKDFTGNKSKLIRATLAEMVSDRVLRQWKDDKGVIQYALAQ